MTSTVDSWAKMPSPRGTYTCRIQARLAFSTLARRWQNCQMSRNRAEFPPGRIPMQISSFDPLTGRIGETVNFLVPKPWSNVFGTSRA
jgi:hypothetical protein